LKGNRVELFSTILLALAAVSTAWSSYQATRWNGEVAKASSKTNGIRIDAARADGLANSQTQIDIATFIQWVDAFAHKDVALQSFYSERFRKEFKPAFAAWRANPRAAPTPFALPEYKLAARTEAERLDREEAISAGVVRQDVQRAGNYVLAVVLFAVALFFAGMSTRLSSPRLGAAMLAVGFVIFGATVVWIATSPVIVSV
jgi:hypothetical protein